MKQLQFKNFSRIGAILQLPLLVLCPSTHQHPPVRLFYFKEIKMEREYIHKKYECLQCFYGFKGHDMFFEGSTTSMTARFLKDGKPVTEYLLYDDMKAIFECLKHVFK